MDLLKKKDKNEKNSTEEKKTKTSSLLKKKEPIVDFDKIDVSTASEDQIIRSGIKKNVKQDKICYAVIALIFVLMLLPPFLRFFFPKPITEVEKEIVYLTLSCVRNDSRNGYSFSAKTTHNYRDGQTQKVILEYTYTKGKNEEETSSDLEEEPQFQEITELNELKYKGLKKEKIENGYKFTLDFENDPTLGSDEVTEKYSYLKGPQQEYYRNLQYYCVASDPEIKIEVVPV